MIFAAPLDLTKVSESMNLMATALGGVLSAVAGSHPTAENIEAATRLRGAIEGACRSAARDAEKPAQEVSAPTPNLSKK